MKKKTLIYGDEQFYGFLKKTIHDIAEEKARELCKEVIKDNCTGLPELVNLFRSLEAFKPSQVSKS